jgi:hypothetical protein
MSGVFDRLREAVSYLILILLNPSQNMRAAILLYITIGVLFALVAVVGALLITGMPDDAATSEGKTRRDRLQSRKRSQPRQRPSARRRVILAACAALALGVVWLAAGYSTSDPGVCKGCHWQTAQHASAPAKADPHAGVGCVSCHESGGFVGRFVTGVPLRAAHAWMAKLDTTTAADYGQVTTRACLRCHARSVRTETTNAARGLKISHKEPMDASASCIDCHTMRLGVVSAYNAGMTQCLRCHDGGQASAECSTCHTKKATAAARARTTSFQKEQIKEIACGGCHMEKRECDPCHGGIRMPHTAEFMGGAHARAAAVDFWYNGGKVCSRCHTATRRPCTGCHTRLIGYAHGVTNTLASSHKTASSTACNTCHGRYAPIATRDFCKDVCHSPAAIAASPR